MWYRVGLQPKAWLGVFHKVAHNGIASFRAFLERVSLPYVLITGLVTTLANLKGALAQAGLRLLAVSVVVVAILWTYYVFTQRVPSQLAPGHSLPVHGRTARVLALVLTVLSLAPVWLAFHPQPAFELPRFSVMVWNEHDSDVSLEPVGEFYITASLSPVIDTQLASGKFQLGNGRDELHVPAKKSISVDGRFTDAALYEGFYQRGDLDIRFVIRTRDGRLLQSNVAPFREEWLIAELIVFYVRSTGA